MSFQTPFTCELEYWKHDIFLTQIKVSDAVLNDFTDLESESMVAYFCHLLSDNYVDLSDLYVVLSDLYVDLSDLYVDLSLIHLLENES